MTLNIILYAATILGGVAAIWYVWEEVQDWLRGRKRGTQVTFLLLGRTATQTPYALPCTIDGADSVSTLIEGFWATSRLVGQDIKAIEGLKSPPAPATLRAYDWRTLREIRPSLRVNRVRTRILLVEDASLQFALEMIKNAMIETSPEVTQQLARFLGKSV